MFKAENLDWICMLYLVAVSRYYRRMNRCLLLLPLLMVSPNCRSDLPADDEVRAGLSRATGFFRTLAVRGGHVWKVSENLAIRKGEEVCGPTQVWVQPPGTPSVGQAFLDAYQAGKAEADWNSALDAGDALAWGQSPSGGWPYSVDFNPDQGKYHHRGLGAAAKGKRRDDSVLDDNNTQGVLRFLLNLSEAGEDRQDPRLDRVRTALETGLDALLGAQRPNGAWPQRFGPGFTDPEIPADLRATPPAEWPRVRDVKDYHVFHTLNDQLHRDCLLLLLEAHRALGRPELREAALRAGEFLLRAQLPEPQPGWAQQYNFRMEPAWARKFEPPAMSSSESKGAIQALLDLYLATGEERFLAPLPSALAWLERSQIRPGVWARFYELGTNRPLYFTREYALTFADTDLPTHYSFQGDYGIPGLVKEVERLRREGREAELRRRENKARTRKELAASARKALDELDAQGRWVKDGWIESERFIDGVNALTAYLRARE